MSLQKLSFHFHVRIESTQQRRAMYDSNSEFLDYGRVKQYLAT